MGRATALAALIWALLAGAAPAQAPTTPPPPLGDADYFTFAGEVVERMERSWRPDERMYRTGARSVDGIANAAMLTVFATAAAHGHAGPARNDERARILAGRLTESPPYYTDPAPPAYDKMFHSPGWTSNMDGPYVDMDKSIDPKVAEGLQIAHRARDVLGLDPALAQRIAEQIHAVSYTPFFRYPLVRLNQINWPAELYAYDYLVNGDATLLREDYRAHVRRFVDGFRRPWSRGGATNVGPTYRFHYQNNEPAPYSRNLDSPEYANMTLHFLYWYDLALSAGMEPLPAGDMRLLRAWMQRDLYGYWTHAGFLNWDTGWSFDRWMKGKTWAYAQQGLLAIATAPAFRMDAREAGYAKYLFDRGLRLYEHLSLQEPDAHFRPSAELFGIGDQGAPSTKMFWVRMAANAARAVSAGMGRMEARRPPPFYALDADIGRLAVSSPRYHTAILATNRGKVPYGGIEMARLYDADGDPISGTGGRPPSAFGVVVSGPRGGRVLASQVGRRQDAERPPVVLTRSPRGRVDRVRPLATRPDAGTFAALDAVGRVRRYGLGITTRHAFRRDEIAVHWTVRQARRAVEPGKGRRRRRAPARRVQVLFPTWGRSAAIEAQLRDGTTVVVGAGVRPRLADVRWFRLRSGHGSYRVVLRDQPRGSVGVLAPRRQRANPRGGPTLALGLPSLRRGRRDLRVRIVPSADGGTRGLLAPQPTPAPTPTATVPAAP